MQRSDYINALERLTTEMIVSSLSSYNDDQLDSQVDRVSRFRKMHPKTNRVVINGIIVFLLMTHNGKLPNDRYLKLTHDSFINEHKIETAEDALDFIINRKMYLLKKKDDKQQKRTSYYNNVVNPDISDVMDPSPEDVIKSKQILEKMNQSKQQ